MAHIQSKRKDQGASRPKKYHTSSRANKCLFFLIAKCLDSNISSWLLKIANAEHNHEFTLAGAYLVHRKIALNEKARTNISYTLTV